MSESGIDFPTGRAMILVAVGVILFGVPALRRLCFRLLSEPVPSQKRAELSLAIVLNIMTGFAMIGAVALWWWSTGGEPALARHLGQPALRELDWDRHVSVRGVAASLLLGGLLAPIVEELVFRGLLYPAWAAQWGWFRSALATSAVFAFCHPFAYSPFLSSLVVTCILRRTGSLRACILAHAIGNILLWYPLPGQFLRPGAEPGELRYWTVHLVCLTAVYFAVPIYMWMSRDAAAESIAPEAQPQAS